MKDRRLVHTRRSALILLALFIYIYGVWGSLLTSVAAPNGPQKQMSPDALGSISGTVLDEEGKALEEATVEVWGQQVERDYYFGFPLEKITYAKLHTLTTDAEGRYSIGALPTGIYRIQASIPESMYVATFWKQARDYDPMGIPVSGEEVTGIDVVLPLGGRISGRISKIEGLSADLYRIAIYQVDDEGRLQSVHSEDFEVGTDEYLTEPLVAGTYRVCAATQSRDFPHDISSVSSECYNDHVTGFEGAADVVVEASKATSNVDFVLGESEQYAQISGTITSSEGGPAVGVKVFAYPAPDGRGPRREAVETDSLGRYLLDRLVPQAYYLNFLTDDTPFFSEYYSDTQTLDEAHEITLLPGELASNVDAELALGATVTGNVLIQGERPPVNGWVRIDALGTGRFGRSAPVDPATGEYQIWGIPSGTYVVEANSFQEPLGSLSGFYGGPTYEDHVPLSVTVGSTVRNIDIVLAEGLYEGQIHGTVASGEGALVGIRVELFHSSLSSDPIFFTHTDEGGHYSVGGLGTGSYFIQFVDPSALYLSEYYGGFTSIRDAVPVFVADGEVTAGVNANLQQAGAISGSVILSDGHSAIGYEVLLKQQIDGYPVPFARHTLTAKGFYEFTDLRPGEYHLFILKPIIADGTYQSETERTVYESPVIVAAGEVSLVGQDNVITVAVPSSLSAISEPALEPLIFLPFSAR